MVTPETMSDAAQHALEDLVELKMYLLGQTQQKPWPMLPRTLTNSCETKKAHSISVESNAAWELLDAGYIEASSSRTFVVSKSGYNYHEREMKRLLA
jgi:hypothetical protein